MGFAVVTRVAEAGSFGNMALPSALWFETEQIGPANNYEGRYEHASKFLGAALLSLRVPVFRLGEILVMDSDDRDQFGRKPSKWDVGIQYVDTTEAAVELVRSLAAPA